MKKVKWWRDILLEHNRTFETFAACPYREKVGGFSLKCVPPRTIKVKGKLTALNQRTSYYNTPNYKESTHLEHELYKECAFNCDKSN
jgi:hypothetical protein